MLLNVVFEHSSTTGNSARCCWLILCSTPGKLAFQWHFDILLAVDILRANVDRANYYQYLTFTALTPVEDEHRTRTAMKAAFCASKDDFSRTYRVKEEIYSVKWTPGQSFEWFLLSAFPLSTSVYSMS
jgi:hypothetical protein